VSMARGLMSRRSARRRISPSKVGMTVSAASMKVTSEPSACVVDAEVATSTYVVDNVTKSCAYRVHVGELQADVSGSDDGHVLRSASDT
jgi:hypothetical protein